MKRRLFLAAALATAAAFPLTAQAQYYAGKTITIVVGYKPGGGYDRTARMLARHLPDHIPGKPSIIVQNMPGANSLIAANHVYNVAKPDGLTIGTFNRNLPIAQLLKVDGVKFDMMGKVVVKGEGIHPLFAWLTKETGGKNIKWNFGKFLIGKDGKLLARYSPTTAPTAENLVADVEKALDA